ncbi:MAG: ribosome biosis GTPase RsgA [Gemmatimonadetes bacterium]|nr:ribosome biosis GTPase RsgA [Gemmatimonadota bacterium]
MNSDNEVRLLGTCLSGTGGIWSVKTDGGDRIEASLAGRLKKSGSGRRPDGSIRRDTMSAASQKLKLAVGDRVVLERDEDNGSWRINEVLPRRSKLARRAPGGGHGERVLAANVDQVLIVFAAAKPEPHPRMLDRFLVIAEANELTARIVINKVDLVGEREARERFDVYSRAGYVVHYTSVKKEIGIAELKDALAGNVSVLTGPSGVGKSSLVNGLFPGLNLRVGEISESVNKGRHTTVGALAHPLPDDQGGGFVVDTPGLREIGMWALALRELDDCFPEFRPHRGECRFQDCAHVSEPGCKIREALQKGEVAAARYDSYLKIREEISSEDPSW